MQPAPVAGPPLLLHARLTELMLSCRMETARHRSCCPAVLELRGSKGFVLQYGNCLAHKVLACRMETARLRVEEAERRQAERERRAQVSSLCSPLRQQCPSGLRSSAHQACKAVPIRPAKQQHCMHCLHCLCVLNCLTLLMSGPYQGRGNFLATCSPLAGRSSAPDAADQRCIVHAGNMKLVLILFGPKQHPGLL